jgi:MoxR-like ATPase
MSASWRVYGGTSVLGPGPVQLGIEFPKSLNDPGDYVPDPGLVDAVNVAIALGQPLLITGEPGTGKTQLAYSMAHQLSKLETESVPVGSKPIVFNTKTTSTARDLFYRYDALQHFRDAQLAKEGKAPQASSYITFEALGLAILRAMPAKPAVAPVVGILMGSPTPVSSEPRSRSVVLIDEVDKAPRDLPNDVLNEIEQMKFKVNETGQEFEADPRLRPIIVLTSNSEKLLPDAFLRRCIFYHLSFPTGPDLAKIVRLRLGEGTAERKVWMANAVTEFEKIREMPLKKKPATAELLAWLRALELLSAEKQGADPSTHPGYQGTKAVLAKNKADLDVMTGKS